MNHPNIVLTGFMGTGKSTIGRRLAKHLGYQFVDTDSLIESRQACSIAEIFASRGEEAFRQMEMEIAQELGVQQGLVISTGGKFLLDDRNRGYLGQTGRIFCLTAGFEEIVRRLNRPHSRAKRPLLAGVDAAQRIHELWQQREPQYRQFEQIDTTGKTADQVCRRIVKLYKKGLSGTSATPPR